MRKEATLEQWKELYDIAIKIKELKPWEYFWNVDLITLVLSEKKQPVYCSIMGRGGEFYGIGSYFGFDAINNFYKIISTTDMPPEQMQRYQEDNVIVCYFGDREELMKKELQIVKELGLKFRGRNNWIYFRSFKKGYSPYMLDEEEVLKKTEVFKHLFMALQDFIEMVINYILNIGKPRRIFVRDEYLLYLLTDLCERGKIDLQVKGRLKAIDRFVESFLNFNFNKKADSFARMNGYLLLFIF